MKMAIEYLLCNLIPQISKLFGKEIFAKHKALNIQTEVI